MAEPISATVLIAAGTAVITGVGVVVSAAGVAHKVWEAHKKDSDKKSDPSTQASQQPLYAGKSETLSRECYAGGRGQARVEADGSITAVGYGPGDWSYGFSTTTSTATYGGKPPSNNVQPTPPYEQAIGFPAPSIPIARRPVPRQLYKNHEQPVQRQVIRPPLPPRSPSPMAGSYGHTGVVEYVPLPTQPYEIEYLHVPAKQMPPLLPPRSPWVGEYGRPALIEYVKPPKQLYMIVDPDMEIQAMVKPPPLPPRSPVARAYSPPPPPYTKYDMTYQEYVDMKKAGWLEEE